MFGGIGFMLNGNLLVGASKRGLLLRVGKDRQSQALAKPGTRQMEMRGRLMDGYIYGFALTKMNLPFDALDDISEMAQTMLEPFPEGEYPNLVAFITEHAMQPGYDFANEFEWGLDVVLDGIEREEQA